MDPIGASTTWRWHGYENSWIELDGQRMQSVSGGGHFGGGLFIWPHGLDVDQEGNVWVTDAVAPKKTPPGKRGHQVIKFSPEGKFLMVLSLAKKQMQLLDTTLIG